MYAGTFATTQGGSITIAADGSYTLTRRPTNFNGTRYGRLHRHRRLALTDVGTLTITVNAVNDAPLAVDDAVTATLRIRCSTSVIDLDANDTDVSTVTRSALSPGTFATTQGGSITIAADGSYTYTRRPLNFNGIDTVDYTVTDGITDRCRYADHYGFNAVNDAPVAVDDAVTATEDTAFQLGRSNSTPTTPISDGDALTRCRRHLSPPPRAAASRSPPTAAIPTRPQRTSTASDTVDYTVTDGIADRCGHVDHYGQCCQ